MYLEKEYTLTTKNGKKFYTIVSCDAYLEEDLDSEKLMLEDLVIDDFVNEDGNIATAEEDKELRPLLSEAIDYTDWQALFNEAEMSSMGFDCFE